MRVLLICVDLILKLSFQHNLIEFTNITKKIIYLKITASATGSSLLADDGETLSDSLPLHLDTKGDTVAWAAVFAKHV